MHPIHALNTPPTKACFVKHCTKSLTRILTPISPPVKSTPSYFHPPHINSRPPAMTLRASSSLHLFVLPSPLTRPPFTNPSHTSSHLSPLSSRHSLRPTNSDPHPAGFCILNSEF